jgi:hypothetical protein
MGRGAVMSELLRSADPRTVAAELRRAGPFRLALGALGVVTLGYAAVSLLRDTDHSKPVELLTWLIGAVIVHDAVIAPATLAAAWVIGRFVPRRARAFVQSGLAIAAVSALFALPLIYRQGRSSAGSALLEQDYTLNLLIIVAVIGVVSALCYAGRVVRDRRREAAATAAPATGDAGADDAGDSQV